MSWDSYIDSLIGHGASHIDKAFLIGQDGSPWTSDGHANALPCSAAEKAKIATEMQRGIGSEFGANGIVVGGIKYQFLRYDGDYQAAYGKKKGSGAITVQLTKQAIIVAHCPEGGQHGVCNEGVQKVVNHLQNAGY